MSPLARRRRWRICRGWATPKTLLLTCPLDGEVYAVTREEIFNTEEPFLQIAGQITAVQRRSKNQLRKNFIKYKIRQGWEIEIISTDDQQASQGSAAFQAATQRLLQKQADDLLTSKPLHAEEFSELTDRIDENESLAEAEFLSYTRTSIELFYRQPLSDRLIQLDRQHRFRRAVQNYELLTDAALLEAKFPEHMIYKKPKSKIKFALFKDFTAAVFLLEGLMKLLPFYVNGTFDASIEYTTADLSKFVENCKKHKVHIEGLLGEDVRSDIDSKPAQQLGRVLKLVGLGQTKTRVSKLGGTKVYHYSLEQESINLMNELVVHRKKYRKEPWKYVHELHGFGSSYMSRHDPDLVDGDAESIELAVQLIRMHQPPFPRAHVMIEE